MATISQGIGSTAVHREGHNWLVRQAAGYLGGTLRVRATPVRVSWVDVDYRTSKVSEVAGVEVVRTRLSEDSSFAVRNHQRAPEVKHHGAGVECRREVADCDCCASVVIDADGAGVQALTTGRLRYDAGATKPGCREKSAGSEIVRIAHVNNDVASRRRHGY